MGCEKNARPTTLTTVTEAMATNTKPPMVALASHKRSNTRSTPELGAFVSLIRTPQSFFIFSLHFG
jgi:hypothetical protein